MQYITYQSAGQRTLVFCIALNGYDIVYAANIESHRRYARRWGYHYELVREPAWVTIDQAVWLKVELLKRAITAGWSEVLFVDADCELRNSAPSLVEAAPENASICLAPGFSGNFNSGVILVRAKMQARAFLARALQLADTSVPEQDWGENGHLIHVEKTMGGVTSLDTKWNNNADTEMDDYIRHYSAGGPMRPLYSYTISGKTALIIARIVGKCRKLLGRDRLPKGKLGSAIARLGERVSVQQPAFGLSFAAERARHGIS